jgi:formamidopyrimidine-DNA glycosylase
MPELPDVERFKRQVEQHCLGRMVARACVPEHPERMGTFDPYQCPHLHISVRFEEFTFVRTEDPGG